MTCETTVLLPKERPVHSRERPRDEGRTDNGLILGAYIALLTFIGVCVYVTYSFSGSISMPYPLPKPLPPPSTWEEVSRGECSAYATRRYEARIYNALQGVRFDWIAECHRTPNEIDGTYFAHPDECIFRRKQGVYGIWNVQTSDALCMPYWGTLASGGCTAPGSGKKRWYARLHGLEVDDSDSRICMTTPTILHGKNYQGPTTCENKGLLGKWGIWDIDDPICVQD